MDLLHHFYEVVHDIKFSVDGSKYRLFTSKLLTFPSRRKVKCTRYFNKNSGKFTANRNLTNASLIIFPTLQSQA